MCVCMHSRVCLFATSRFVVPCLRLKEWVLSLCELFISGNKPY